MPRGNTQHYENQTAVIKVIKSVPRCLGLQVCFCVECPTPPPCKTFKCGYCKDRPSCPCWLLHDPAWHTALVGHMAKRAKRDAQVTRLMKRARRVSCDDRVETEHAATLNLVDARRGAP